MSTKTLVIFSAWVILSLSGFRDSVTDVSAALYGGLTPQSFVKSVSDANLMYELLLRGMVIDADNNMAVRDQEMASMRQGRAVLALLNDNIPKTVSAMEQMLDTLEGQKNPLAPARFETLILGAIYSAHQARRQESEEEQQAWADVLIRLANVTLVQLRSTKPIASYQ